MKDLLSRMEEFVVRYTLWPAGGRILVACSGGPDSLALLSLVLKLQEKQKLVVWAAHFEHGIRGTASLEDALFVKDFCEERKVPFHLAREDVPAYARRHKLSLETAARQRRYAFLRRVAAEMGEGTVIAVGHHADDQAETVLMRILRGTGIDGLAAMRARTGEIVRPLLSFSRQEIEAYCRQEAMEPRRDATNEVPDAFRNRIRLELMPLLCQSYNPAMVRALCRLASIAAAESDFLRYAVQSAWGGMTRAIPYGWEIDAVIFSRQPEAVQEGVLRYMAERLAISGRMAFSHYTALKNLLLYGAVGKMITLPRGFRAIKAYHVVRVRREGHEIKEWSATILQVPGDTVLQGLGLKVRSRIVSSIPSDLGAASIVVDASILPFPWLVRPRQDGDTVTLERGTTKLKKLLIDSKVLREKRSEVPILAAGGRIFWVGGVRQSAWGRVGKNTTKMVRLDLLRDMEEE